MPLCCVSQNPFKICFVSRIFRTVSFLRSIEGSRSSTRMTSTRNSQTESRGRLRFPFVISEVTRAVLLLSCKIRGIHRTFFRVVWIELRGSAVELWVLCGGMVSDPWFTTQSGISERGVSESTATWAYFPVRISSSICLRIVCFSRSRCMAVSRPFVIASSKSNPAFSPDKRDLGSVRPR